MIYRTKNERLVNVSHLVILFCHGYVKLNLQDRFFEFPSEQHSIVLQIGGSNLENLAKAAELANFYGYDEINLTFVTFLSFRVKLCGSALHLFYY